MPTCQAENNLRVAAMVAVFGGNTCGGFGWKKSPNRRQLLRCFVAFYFLVAREWHVETNGHKKSTWTKS